jgi:hypothetical protein
MSKKNPPIKFLPKKTLFFLVLSSLILFIFSFAYFLFVNNNQTNNSPYYKSLGVQNTSRTIITQKESWSAHNLQDKTGLLAKETIGENFIAQTDNLGIIEIPFNTNNRSIDDKVIFSIKESNKQSWDYQATYDAHQFQNNIPFPFGFPVINNSKNKSYTFQLESLNGRSGDTLSLNQTDNYFFTKYKFSKTELVKSPKELFEFLVAKIIEQLQLLAVGKIIFLILFSILFPFTGYLIFVYLKKIVKIRLKKINLVFSYRQKIGKSTEIKSIFFTFIQRNSVTVMILFLLLILGTNNFYNYVKFPVISSTEARLVADPTNDFYTGVYFEAKQMIQGKKMDINVLLPGYINPLGYLIPILFSPFLLFLKPDQYTAYFYLLLIAIVVFVIFFTLLMRKSDKQIMNGGLIFLIAFLLSHAGLLGIFMGNVDILLAPLIGFLVLLLLHSIKKKSISVIQSIALGILAGVFMNIKIFLLPFSLLIIFFSKRSILTTITTSTTFLALVYLPNLFGTESSLALYIKNLVDWNIQNRLSANPLSNHSIYIIASFFTQCLKFNTCDTQITNTLVALLLLLLTFATPFLLTRPITKIIFNKNIYFSIMKLRNSKEFAVVLVVLSLAFINLVFVNVYDYRLYYSLIIALILLKETAKIKKALVYCYLSMFSLLLGGIWAIQLNPNEPWTIDGRLLKFFYIFHFIFLILSALTYWKESQTKAVVKISRAKINSVYRKKIIIGGITG